MQALFDAIDIAGLSTNVSALIVGLLGVGLLFLGRRYVEKAIKVRT